MKKIIVILRLAFLQPVLGGPIAKSQHIPILAGSKAVQTGMATYLRFNFAIGTFLKLEDASLIERL